MGPVISFFKSFSTDLSPEPVPDLNLDALRYILGLLERSDIVRASQVCKSWNRAVKESASLKSKIFVKFPKPLQEYLSRLENYGRIPIFKVKGGKSEKVSDDGLFQGISLHEGHCMYVFGIAAKDMTAPVMFIQEPWKRTAIAIKYHLTLPDGKENDFAIVLHDLGPNMPHIWSSSQSWEFKDVNLSCLFHNNWQANRFGEYDYLKNLLNGEACGRINKSSLAVIEPPTFKNDKGEEIPYIRICSK